MFIRLCLTSVAFYFQLTSVSIERGKGDSLLCWAGAVCDLHLQFVPGRLLQVIQDIALGKWCALGCGPGGWLHRPVFQYEGGDWTTTIVPAGQVEPGPGRVDAGEEFMFFGKLGFWEEDDIILSDYRPRWNLINPNVFLVNSNPEYFTLT